MSTAASIPIIPSIAPLAATSEAWLVDIWGVMHNGVAPFHPAVEACKRFRAGGGTVLLLSNAPRPNSSVRTQLDRIGVERAAYDAILSSGDASRAMIAEVARSRERVAHLGPERDLPLFEGLGVALAPLEEATVVVCTGLLDDTTETPADYAQALDAMARRSIRMICANPDLKVERGNRIIYCAGAIAAAYAARGGEVVYAGKPYAETYDLAFKQLAMLRKVETVARGRVLAIGDGVATDIKGAANAGVRSVFVASGIHVGEEGLEGANLARLFEGIATLPVAAMNALVW